MSNKSTQPIFAYFLHFQDYSYCVQIYQWYSNDLDSIKFKFVLK